MLDKNQYKIFHHQPQYLCRFHLSPYLFLSIHWFTSFLIDWLIGIISWFTISTTLALNSKTYLLFTKKDLCTWQASFSLPQSLYPALVQCPKTKYLTAHVFPRQLKATALLRTTLSLP